MSEPFHNEVEEAIADIWSDILETDITHRDADFVEHGGTSLLAVQMMVQVRAEFDVSVPLKEFFADPRVGSLADRVIDTQISRLSADEIDRLLGAGADDPDPGRAAGVDRD